MRHRAGAGHAPAMELRPPALSERSLQDLRRWAWEHGRTDIVGRLDGRSAALAFVASPSAAALGRLRDLLPVRPRADWVADSVEEASRNARGSDALDALARNLAPWIALLGWQLVADHDEMSADLQARWRPR